MTKRVIDGLIGLCFVTGGIGGFYWLTQQEPKTTHQIIGALDGFVIFCILAVMFGIGMSMIVNAYFGRNP